MKLSVLMAVYYKESPKPLSDCLDSLVAQTHQADEVVIVEDGPLGQALKEVISSFASKLPLIHLRLPVNQGLGLALRAGLSRCRGPLVARMDSDDICIPQRFERQLAFLEQNPQVDIVGGAIAEFDEDWLVPHSMRPLPASGLALTRFAKWRCPLNHMTVMFKKSSVMAAGNYQHCPGFEDYQLWARMLSRGFNIHNLPDVLVNVRCGNGMQARRGGLMYAKQETEIQLQLRKLGFLSNFECLRNLILRSPVRVVPSAARSILYRSFLRNKPVTGTDWATLRRQIQSGTEISSTSPLTRPDHSNGEGKKPLVSIITPVYNAAQWLPETLATVRAQTLTDWEHILVDDGSSDESVEIIKAAVSADSRCRLERLSTNQGSPAARNLALDSARGRYIAFLDADDLWHPDKLARSIEWMTAHGYEFVYHDYRHIAPDGSHVGAVVAGPDTLDLRALHTRRGTGCLTVVIDRERVPSIRFPLLKRPYHAEDFCLWLYLIKNGHTGHRLPLDLAHYRLTPGSRSSRKIEGAWNAWRLYRNLSHLPFLRAASWWMQYAWNAFWLHHAARPRERICPAPR